MTNWKRILMSKAINNTDNLADLYRLREAILVHLSFSGKDPLNNNVKEIQIMLKCKKEEIQEKNLTEYFRESDEKKRGI